MEGFATFAKNLKKLPGATSNILTNVSKLQTFHQLLQDRRDRFAPLAYHTYDNMKQKTTWHPVAHAWVDEALPISKKEYNEYCLLKKDMQRLLPVASPLVFGIYGLLPVAVWLSKDGYLPSAFSSKKDVIAKKLEWYATYGDDLRQQVGPMLQHRLKRHLRGTLNNEHRYMVDEAMESYKEIFYSHYTGAVRDVRKCAHLRLYDGTPSALLLTNKEPIELTPALLKKLNEIKAAKLAPEDEKSARNAALVEAYKLQELKGGPAVKHMQGYGIPENTTLIGENAKGDNFTQPPEGSAIPLEELEWTGDTVYVPAEYRTEMEEWGRELQKLANQFLLLPWRFVSSAWNQRRLVSWFEEILQEDALIAKEGGVQALSDDELKVALLDRAVLRLDEDVTRGEMEARYKEISWLMSLRNPFIVLAWQTGYFRSTYSPEDDLPEPSILPKLNRTILDVDVHNYLAPDAPGRPLPRVHPALFPNAHVTMAKEVAMLAK